MQNNNSQQDGHRRIRNVPIRLEGESAAENCRYVNNQHLDDGQEHMDCESHSQYYQQQQSHAHQQFTGPNLSQANQRAPQTHTSSIDINYKAPPSQHNTRQHKHTSQQPKGFIVNDNDAFNQTNNSSQFNPQSETYDLNKENSESYIDRNKSPPTGDSAIDKKPAESDTELQEPKKPDPVIPLPPPPKQPASEKKDSETEQHEEQDQGEESNSEKVKQDSGPQCVINSTKAEVNRLLIEIANCNETSVKSKEYIRLDELLTVCILKLDDIQLPEWRQQRKEVINLINKCTELLERKVNLNRDIQQLSANCS